MSYEPKNYIVWPAYSNYDTTLKKFWARTIAEFRLDNSSELYDIFTNYPEASCFFYDENERPIVEDKLGEPIREVTLVKLIEDLESYNNSRRDNDIKAILPALKVYANNPGTLVALIYGA